MTMSVPVALGERSYHIHIGEGLLSQSGELLAPHAKGRVAVVTDEVVNKLHYGAFAAGLEQAGLKPEPIVLPAGEHVKTFEHLQQLIDTLLCMNLPRSAMIVALGGGVIGDLTGFAAGILKRGVNFAQVPTTLLAQVDSSVGGKTAINTGHGKNLVGLYHQPRVVIADTGVLGTLPKRELRSGYAEIAKYGLIGDAEFFSWLERHAEGALAGDIRALGHAIAHSCAMKASFVTRDEREAGDRALLNLGHTFGHALEAATGYGDRLTHGESVAIGCVLAMKLSARLGHASPDDAARTARHLESMGLPIRISQIAGGPLSGDAILGHMRHDKKAHDSGLTFVLAKGIGKAFVAHDVPEDAVRAALAEEKD
jgi:3-dehydroquinate synthase